MPEAKDFIKLFKKTCRYEEDILINNSKANGYWSNLNKSENKKLVTEAIKTDPKKAIRKIQPRLEDVIYSKEREAG